MPSPEDLNFARQVVANGICQRSEVEECLTHQHQEEQRGKASKLAEVLIERGYLTRSQCERFTKSGALAVVSTEAANLRIGSYELLLKIGEGGMGAVYKARDTRNDHIVALKVLPRSKARDDIFLKRFELEARAAFELNHPNIVRGYDVGHEDGYHFLVMEFVQGYDVCALLEQHGRFSETEALNIVEQMSKALDHIAAEHLVHRDIKPENILVTSDNIAKLADMGLTVADATHGRRKRLTQAGIAMGTPFYLSPEQIKGESEVDIRSDIYALGATTYEMVTGRPPFEGETPAVVMMKHLNEQVPSPHDLDRTISINFCHLLERMMAKDSFHRYQTPYEMLQDVRRVIKGKQPVGIRPPAGRSSVARPVMHSESKRIERPSSSPVMRINSKSGVREAAKESGKPANKQHESVAIADVVNKLRPYAAQLPARGDNPKTPRPDPGTIPQEDPAPTPRRDRSPKSDTSVPRHSSRSWYIYFLLGASMATVAALAWYFVTR